MSDNTNPFNPVPSSETTDGVNDLAGLDAEFEKTEAADTDELPDGKYQVRIHGVRLDKTMNGAPMIKYDLLVISGTHEGRHLFKNSVISPSSLPFFKADLKILGVQLQKLSDLPDHLIHMLDITLEATKKTKGEYANVYFNKKLTIPQNNPSPADGSIPF
jgi:hypothetical protein